MFYLPDEFVLKKYIVALVIALNILLCKFEDALIQIVTNVVDLIRAAATVAKVKTTKTIIQVCLDIVHHNKVSVEPIFSEVDVLLFVDNAVTFELRKT